MIFVVYPGVFTMSSKELTELTELNTGSHQTACSTVTHYIWVTGRQCKSSCVEVVEISKGRPETLANAPYDFALFYFFTHLRALKPSQH